MVEGSNAGGNQKKFMLEESKMNEGTAKLKFGLLPKFRSKKLSQKCLFWTP
jgi:hypothetical protein